MTELVSSSVSSTEIALDIMAFAQICIRLGFEESVENQRVFVGMINEIGFRTPRGDEFTYMGYRKMMERLPKEIRDRGIEELCGNSLVEINYGYNEIETYDDNCG